MIQFQSAPVSVVKTDSLATLLELKHAEEAAEKAEVEKLQLEVNAQQANLAEANKLSLKNKVEAGQISAAAGVCGLAALGSYAMIHLGANISVDLLSYVFVGGTILSIPFVLCSASGWASFRTLKKRERKLQCEFEELNK